MASNGVMPVKRRPAASNVIKRNIENANTTYDIDNDHELYRDESK
jgi:hypothetical protein